ncbi:dehydrogenase/reductase SDR family member on chromosome X isoform X1 [Astyanax mexicanus]|uniref:dehydrogenase/reductase SDR family member on chromosome X isoform X1 n=1 Tax=Astyanax mexicanus TaxID=7994 RepID=UPI0020CB47E1|nr:dehydrogenase/reductase SDR family member on chromosome X isoform X1 [Astyanax mexicanus]
MWILSQILPVLKLYLTGLKVLLHQLLHRAFTCPVLPLQSGRVAIVTGGARGLGYEVARKLTSLRMHVIIASRDEEQGLAAVKRLRGERSTARVDFEFLDLASLDSVRRFVRRFEDRKLPLHALINNAGIMLVPEGQTEDGFELHFAVNYLGHVLLTRLLLSVMVRSGTEKTHSRIISICSAAHYTSRAHLQDLQDLLNRQCYSPHAAYSHSKLAQVLFTYHLQQELQSAGFPVTASAVDPGMVDTDLYRNLSTPTRLAQRLIARLLFRSPSQAAHTAVFAAASPELEGVGGCYLYEGNRVQSSEASYSVELQTRLWRNTCSLLGLPESLLA